MDLKFNKKLEDQPLVERVLHGDTNAFQVIIQRTEGLVAQIIFKMVDNKEDRKDIAQDVYLKVFQSLKGFRFQSKLSTWVGQIAYNSAVNYLRKKKLVLVENSSDSEDAGNISLESLYSAENGSLANEAENILSKKELAGILKLEIDRLSPLFKTLVTLYHNEDLSYSEIAEITQLPEGTVKSYLFRARKTLRNRLMPMYKMEQL
ncbi:sigma-70 family RNA polymerase sigma factor [Flavihumibacter profundi]|uniref:sigma-70 family RNA polymerase sigma factor n=1 Tax=Flavihumibacter profundi TaxID=2716883 RepID=UPI001CC7116B|nr:sigma-70 family RNA polymerase sigma factor [Flavihumibacter profundi]MBZ5856810.1 sigma-70 family RNA polymerase sigma factor [Flavihumibacter profundi]